MTDDLSPSEQAELARIIGSEAGRRIIARHKELVERNGTAHVKVDLHYDGHGLREVAVDPHYVTKVNRRMA